MKRFLVLFALNFLFATGIFAQAVNPVVIPKSAPVLNSNASGQVGNSTAHNLTQPASCADTSGSGTAQSCTTSPTFSPATGDTIIYKTTTSNTGDVTVNVNSSSAIHIRKWLGSATLASGDLPANTPEPLYYDGTYWEALTIGNAPSGGGTVTVSGSLTSGTPTEGVSSTVIKNGVLSDFETFGLLNNCMTTLGDVLYGGASGACARLAGPTAPGVYFLTETPASSAATAETFALAGVKPNPQTGTTYTYLSTDSTQDRAGYTSFSNASSIAVTLPPAGSTGFGSNWVNVSCDIGAGTATITPTTSTISYSNGSTYTSAASTMALTTGQCAFIYSDNSNYFAIKFASGSGAVSSVANSDGTLTISPTTGSVVVSLNLGHADTWTAAHVFSVAGAASAPGLSVTGAPYTGGSTTTNFPQFYINDGAGPTTFSAAGTEFGINTPSGFTGNFMDFHVNGGASVSSLNYLGAFTGLSYTANGSTAGFVDYPQGSTSAAIAPCSTANSICVQAPTSVTSQLRVFAGAPATGFPLYTNSSGTMTETITPVDGTISTGPFLFGPSAVNTVVAQTIAVAAGHFTNLVMTSSLGGTCTTAPTFNVFDGTSNTGTAKIATSTTQTKGTATSQAQTLTFAAGDLIGIYISTAGSGCTADTWVVSAEYSTP